MKTNLLFVIYPLYRKSPTTVGIIKNIDIAIMPMPRKQHFAKYPELVTVYSWVPPKRLLSFWRKLGWLDLQPPKATLWWIDLESICGKRSSLPKNGYVVQGTFQNSWTMDLVVRGKMTIITEVTILYLLSDFYIMALVITRVNWIRLIGFFYWLKVIKWVFL